MNVESSASQMPTYNPNKTHRNGAPNSSQWTITPGDELASFHLAVRHSWLDETVGYGLHVVANRAEILGVSNAQQTFIAKFVSSKDPFVWHGYPILTTDRDSLLPAAIGKDWIRFGFIRPALVRKALRGQRCSL